MKKRLVSMILSAVLFATSVPVAAFAEDANTQNPVVRKRLNFRHGYKNPRPHFCNRSTLIIHI